MYLKSALGVRKRFTHNALTPNVSITNASQNLGRIRGRRELIYLITAIKSHTALAQMLWHKCSTRATQRWRGLIKLL